MFTQIVDPPVSYPQQVHLPKGVTRSEAMDLQRLLYSEFHTPTEVGDHGWGRHRHYVLKAENFSGPARMHLEQYTERRKGSTVRDDGVQSGLVKIRAQALYTVNSQIQR